MMYAGGVITGSWLPYKDIHYKGVKMRQVDSADNVGYELAAYLVTPFNESVLKTNKDLIRSQEYNR